MDFSELCSSYKLIEMSDLKINWDALPETTQLEIKIEHDIKVLNIIFIAVAIFLFLAGTACIIYSFYLANKI